MPVHDLWKGLSSAEMLKKRAKNAVRYQRRWRDGTGRGATQHKQSYPESQRAQAYIDEARQQAAVGRSPRPGRVTVSVLLDRHLSARADRAPRTVKDYHNRADAVRRAFGSRAVSTLSPTEVEAWAARAGVAAESRKKTLEILRAAIKRGIRDGLIYDDPTAGIIVSLGHKERPYWSSEELIDVLTAAPSDSDRALLGVQGLMGLRSGEAQSLKVGDLQNGTLRVRNSGADADSTKTRASTRVLPVPTSLLSLLSALAGDRGPDEWLFASPRRHGRPISARYATSALHRAVSLANENREHQIADMNVHGLRHTFAAVALGELGADLISVSRALGHSRPSTTLNFYGHLAPAGLESLMERIGALGGSLDA